MYEDVSIDIESLALNSSHVTVVSFAAVVFNSWAPMESLDAYDDEDRIFRVNLDLEQQINTFKRKVDGSTVRWWVGQGALARKEFTRGEVDCGTAMMEFYSFLSRHKVKRHWGYGKEFDVENLATLHADVFLDNRYPCVYQDRMDLRTLLFIAGYRGMGGLNLPRGTEHDPVWDAIAQAQGVQHCFERIASNGRP